MHGDCREQTLPLCLTISFAVMSAADDNYLNTVYLPGYPYLPLGHGASTRERHRASSARPASSRPSRERHATSTVRRRRDSRSRSPPDGRVGKATRGEARVGGGVRRRRQSVFASVYYRSSSELATGNRERHFPFRGRPRRCSRTRSPSMKQFSSKRRRRTPSSSSSGKQRQ